MSQVERMGGFFAENRLHPVINAAGNMTVLGASLANEETVAAAVDILGYFVEMPELQRRASEVISEVCSAEAGCVTACAAAGISIAVAAAITGGDIAQIENLPDTTGLKNQIIIQRGHNCHFSGAIDQMIRLPGADIVEIGAINRATADQLAAALGLHTAAALYVVSHQTAQTGMIGLAEFSRICKASGVPVIVDAAAEYNLKYFLAQGADLVLYSAHKYLCGLTAGIIAGRKDLVRACYLQEQGIGRAMKAGKESVASTIAALERWSQLDHDAIEARNLSRATAARSRLKDIDGVTTWLEADPTGSPVSRVRLRIDASVTGIAAEPLRRLLAHGTPAIYLRKHDTDPCSLLIDPGTVTDQEMKQVTNRITHVLNTPAAIAAAKDIQLPPGENLTHWPGPPPRMTPADGDPNVATASTQERSLK